MEATQVLVTAVLAVVVLVALFRRARSGGHHDAGSPGISPAVPRVNVSDPALARLMLVEHADVFSDKPNPLFPVKFVPGPRVDVSYSITTAPHGPLWRALRCNLTAGIFHPSRVGLLAPLQRQAVDGLVASLTCGQEEGAVVVVRGSVHTAVLTLMVRMCFGDGVDARDVRAVQLVLHDFFDGMADAVELTSSRIARLLRWRRWRRFLSVRRRMTQLLLPLVAERQQRRRVISDVAADVVPPYVDSLLDLEVPNHDGAGVRRPLTDDEMVTLIWEFLDAGTETVVSCVEWTLAHLVDKPEVQRKLRREVDVAGGGDDSRRLRDLPYLRAVILESLRLHPPVAFVEREVGAEGAALAGKAIPADSTRMRFTVITGHIGRDGKAWTDPGEFRPERLLAGGEGESVGPMPGPKEIRMMPFGAGTRHCPGEALGMANVRLFVAALVREFEWTAPAKGSSGVDLTEVDGFVKHMKTPLKARITPRRTYSS